jgi:hypothetical protein
VQAGSEREGSSTGMLFIETLDWRQEVGVTTLVLGAARSPACANCCRCACATANRWNWPAASGSGSSSAGGGEVADVSADSARWALDETGLQALAGVRAERGFYPVAGALRIEVVPTYLRDAKGSDPPDRLIAR